MPSWTSACFGFCGRQCLRYLLVEASVSTTVDFPHGLQPTRDGLQLNQKSLDVHWDFLEGHRSCKRARLTLLGVEEVMMPMSKENAFERIV